jgi:hypothetical protein
MVVGTGRGHSYCGKHSNIDYDDGDDYDDDNDHNDEDNNKGGGGGGGNNDKTFSSNWPHEIHIKESD